MMKLRSLSLLLLAPITLCAAAEKQPVNRPNILFIMTDDHAAHSISAYGSKVNRTPNLDQLAADGVRFKNAFVTNSICTPSRATLLTGKYSHLNGTPVFNRFDGEQQTVAKLMQAGGYYTMMLGKWHLGSDPTGFDKWNILPGQGRYWDPMLYDNTGMRVYPGYATHVITDLGIDALKQRPKDKPFFMMLHHKAPHRAWEPTPEMVAKFANLTIPEPATLRDDYATRPAALPENDQSLVRSLTRGDLKLTPPADLPPDQTKKWLAVRPTEVEVEENGVKKTLSGESLLTWKYQRLMRDYLACVQSVDDEIGRLRKWLADEGLAQNTVVIYTTDNGFFMGDHGMYDKRFMYDHSLRIPLMVSWPGVTNAGAVSDLFALNVDYAPTFLDIAGLPVPSDMQGHSLVPVLKGAKPSDWRKSMYYRYYHDPGHHNTRSHYGVRTDTHKLIYFWKKDAWELFDLVKDPDELNNIYDAPGSAELVKTMKKELSRLRAELKDDDQFADKVPPDDAEGGKHPWQPGQGPNGPTSK